MLYRFEKPHGQPHGMFEYAHCSGLHYQEKTLMVENILLNLCSPQTKDVFITVTSPGVQ